MREPTASPAMQQLQAQAQERAAANKESQQAQGSPSPKSGSQEDSGKDAAAQFAGILALSNQAQALSGKVVGEQNSKPLSNPVQAAAQQAMAQAGITAQELAQAQAQAQARAVSGGQEKMATAKMPVASEIRTDASLNTVAAIAGLKPWSKEWVFRGQDVANPELKTLISEKEPMAGKGLSLNDIPRPLFGNALPVAEESTGSINQSRSDAQAPNAQQSAFGAASVVSAADLGHALAALNGQLEMVDSDQPLGGEKPKFSVNSAKGQMPSKLGAQLSGAEFIETRMPTEVAQSEPRVVFENGKLVVKSEEERNKGDSLKSQQQGDGFASVAQHSMLGQPAHALNASAPMPQAEVTGHVTSGAMAQDRLSSESLIGLGTQIKSFGAQGGGEIRVRLKPENLGELHLRVVTSGKDVGLQIQASDENAKKILEESLTHLRDSLASQSLSLSHVDVSVAQAPGQASGQSLSHDQYSQPQHQQQQASSQWQEGRRDSRSAFDLDDRTAARPSSLRSAAATRSMASASPRASVMGGGRLDVRA